MATGGFSATGFGAGSSSGFSSTGFGASSASSSSSTGFGASSASSSSSTSAGFGGSSAGFGASSSAPSSSAGFGAPSSAAAGSSSSTGFGAGSSSGFGASAGFGGSSSSSAPSASASAPAAGSSSSAGFGASASAPAGSSSSSGFGAGFGASASGSASSSMFAAESSSGSQPAAGGAASGSGATPNPASRIKNLTINEIIENWNQELDSHVRSFTEQALDVRRWDEQLIANNQQILALQREVSKVQSQQRQLHLDLDTIHTSQKDLMKMIDELESAVDSIPQGTLSQDDMKRAQAYTMAEDVDKQLMQMSMRIKEIIESLNQSSERALDPSNPLTQVVKILNAHMTSLQWIEQRAVEIEHGLHDADAHLKHRESQRQQQF